MAQQRYKLIENKQLTNSKIKKIKKIGVGRDSGMGCKRGGGGMHGICHG